MAAGRRSWALLALLCVAVFGQAVAQLEGVCPGFAPTLGMQNYTDNCNACLAAGCGVCSPPPNKANQLGEASCLQDASFCHSSHYYTAEDKHAQSVCHVTIIPFAAVIGVLVALVLCCGGCTGYCCYTLQKQRKLKRMIKEKQTVDQRAQLQQQQPQPPRPLPVAQPVPANAILQERSDKDEPVATPTARNV